MNARTQITLDTETQQRARARAAQLGISFAEFVRRAVEQSLGAPVPKADVSVIFDLVKDGPVTDIARDKDKMIGQAIWEEHRRSIGGGPRRPAGSKRGKR